VKHAEDNRVFDTHVAEKQSLEKALCEFNLDAGEAELQQKLSEQKDKRGEQNALHEAQQSVRQRLRDLRHRWVQWLKRGAELKLDNLVETLTVADKLLDALAAPEEAAGLASLPCLAERFHELFQAVGKLLEPHSHSAHEE
jgi:hypothetical protein